MRHLTFEKREKEYEPIFSEIDIWTRPNEEKYGDTDYKINIVDRKGKVVKMIDARLVKKDVFLWDEITQDIAGLVMGTIKTKPLGIKCIARRGDMMMDTMVRFNGEGHKGKSTQYVLLTFEAIT